MSDRDLLETRHANGNVTSSSQLRFQSDNKFKTVYTPMEGIILEVKPSDDPDNLSSTIEWSDNRGHRHECTVLITDANSEPMLLLENVVIPPSKHSGMDDFEEDLPRGVSGHLDKEKLSKNWAHIDLSRLDGEHCVVSFLGGSIDKPYISNWWHHPANKFDPSTTGQACLAQADPKKQKSRAMRRVNGVLQMVSPEGDVYLNTNEANSTVEITPKYKRSMKNSGGSVQVDIKKTQQLEINWNLPIEGMKANGNSSSQEREPSLPHVDHAKAIAAPKPAKRETTRTILRYKEYEVLEKSSSFTVWCQKAGDKKGEYVLLAEDSVNLYVRSGDGPSTTIHISNGVIQIVNNDGSSVNIAADQVNIVTKSGGMINVNGKDITLAGKIDASGPMAVGGPTGQPTILGTTYSTLEGVYLEAEAKFGKDAAILFNALAAACSVPPLTPLGAKFADLAAAFTAFTAAATVLKGAMPQMMSKNLTTS